MFVNSSFIFGLITSLTLLSSGFCSAGVSVGFTSVEGTTSASFVGTVSTAWLTASVTCSSTLLFSHIKFY